MRSFILVIIMILGITGCSFDKTVSVTEKTEVKTQYQVVDDKGNILYFTDGKATKEELEKYSQKKEEYYRQFCKEDTEKFHLVDGVCEFFDHLKEKDIPFTIASASIKENIDFFIESFGLDRWIKPEDIVYDDGTYENKIAMFHKAADVIGIDMKDIRIYEDSNSGIRNAYDAGCEQIVVICDKENEEEFLKRPGVIEVMQDFSFAKEL